MIGFKPDVDSNSANGDIHGVTNTGADDDLEMADRANKVNKIVLEDGPLDDSTQSKKLPKIADAIDKTSRILFPLAFVVYNIFYWAYY